jgi:tRNA pseudouridine(55) synthase
MKVVAAWKKEGLTPFQLVQLIKQDNKYKDKKIGFAGRLDPMAEGIMLFLIDEENKKRKAYEKLPKSYEFEVLFGVNTDTYDILGIPKLIKSRNTNFDSIANNLIGKHMQKYPPFSSPRIHGKALHWWARNNKLHEIEIPKKEIEIYSCKFLGVREVTFIKILKENKRRIRKIRGDFRQEEILNAWEQLYSQNRNSNFTIAKFKIRCKGGTYVRSMANSIGGIAYKIVRTAVGSYDKNSVVLISEDETAKNKIS